MGIEPTFSAWEADVLPLNYTRMDEPEFYCIATASQRRSEGGQGVWFRHGRSATGAGPPDRRPAMVHRSAGVRGVAQIGAMSASRARLLPIPRQTRRIPVFSRCRTNTTPTSRTPPYSRLLVDRNRGRDAWRCGGGSGRGWAFLRVRPIVLVAASGNRYPLEVSAIA
jgi:hypothetical protein